MRLQRNTRLPLPKAGGDTGVLDLEVNKCQCRSRVPDFSASTSLPPFAPRPLRRFNTTMKALTSARVSLHVQISLLHAYCLPDHSVPNHLEAPVVALTRYTVFLSATDFPRVFQYLTSYFPLGSRLRHRIAGSPDTHGRNGFVNLRTGRSPPIASHPASRRRSYRRLQVVA